MITVITQQPAQGESHASPSSSIRLIASTDLWLGFADTGSFIDINGVRAWSIEDGFAYPDFISAGNTAVAAGSTLFSLALQPRRHFLYDVKVVVTGQLQAFVSIDPYVYETLVLPPLNFFIQSEPLRGSVRITSALSAPLADVVAIRAFQQILLGTLTQPTTASVEVVFKRRVAASPLRYLLAQTGVLADVERAQLQRVRRSDVVNVSDAIAQLDRVSILWPGVLSELEGLGVSTQDAELLDACWHSQSPTNKVAAACAAVLKAGGVV